MHKQVAQQAEGERGGAEDRASSEGERERGRKREIERERGIDIRDALSALSAQFTQLSRAQLQLSPAAILLSHALPLSRSLRDFTFYMTLCKSLGSCGYVEDTKQPGMPIRMEAGKDFKWITTSMAAATTAAAAATC